MAGADTTSQTHSPPGARASPGPLTPDEKSADSIFTRGFSAFLQEDQTPVVFPSLVAAKGRVRKDEPRFRSRHKSRCALVCILPGSSDSYLRDHVNFPASPNHSYDLLWQDFTP